MLAIGMKRFLEEFCESNDSSFFFFFFDKTLSTLVRAPIHMVKEVRPSLGRSKPLDDTLVIYETLKRRLTPTANM